MKIHHLPRVLSKTGLLASSMAMVLSAPSTSFAAEGFALLEEIIITARKRAESLQDTPISVAAFSADSLNDRQIESADQLTQVTPNLSFSSYAPSAGNNASSQIFIRGIGQTEFLPTTDPGVGLYIDEVYMARSVGATIDFVDLEQIEILRGPQGTLFGRNTIGGAINITTRKPGEEFGGSIDLKAGSDNRQEARVTIDMPVSENLLTTISVGSRKRDGYVDRILTGDELGDDESLGGRFAVLWTPTDNSSYYLTSDYVKENEGGSPIVFNGLGITQPPNLFAFLAINGILSAPLGTPSCATLDASLQARCTSGDWDADQEKSFGTFPVESYFETWGTSLTASWDLEWMSIKSITAYRDMEWTGSRDADSTPLQILHTRNDDTQEQFSQEMQFSGIAMDDKLNWLVENDSQAVFGQLTYDLSDRLALTLGARWTEENKAFKPLQFAETAYLFPVAPSEIAGGVYVHPFDGNTYPLAFGGVAASVPAGTLFFPEEWREESYSDTTFMANLAYEITDSIMLYGSFSEGFKSGGFNARNVKPGVEVRTFSPELATTYELGFKADLLDGSLRLNGAVFQTDYEDLQFVIREDFAPIVFNAGESEIRGLELEWTWIPTSALQIVGGLGYVDAEYKSLDAELQAAGVTTANEMPHVPELSANLGVAYTFNLSSGTTLTPRIDWSYRDDVFFDALNQTDIDQTGYDIVNASVSWENTDETINVVLAATNLGFWGFSPLKRQKSL